MKRFSNGGGGLPTILLYVPIPLSNVIIFIMSLKGDTRNKKKKKQRASILTTARNSYIKRGSSPHGGVRTSCYIIYSPSSSPSRANARL